MKINKEIKQKLKEYQEQLIREQQEKDILINHSTDWGYLEQLIQKVNENPELVVEINTVDGTKIRLKTYNEKLRRKDNINGIIEI